MLNPLRARSHDGHLSLQDIDELWKFIDPRPADEGADLCDSVVMAACGMRSSVFFRIDNHRAEFQDAKHLSSLGASLLFKKNRPMVFPLDRQSHQGEDGQEQNQRQRGTHDIK